MSHQTLPMDPASWKGSGALENCSAAEGQILILVIGAQSRLWMAEWRHRQQDDNLCALCAHGVETADHLLAGCVFSRELWTRVLHGVQLAVSVPSMDVQLVCWWLACNERLSSEVRKGFDSVVLRFQFPCSTQPL